MSPRLESPSDRDYVYLDVYTENKAKIKGNYLPATEMEKAFVIDSNLVCTVIDSRGLCYDLPSVRHPEELVSRAYGHVRVLRTMMLRPHVSFTEVTSKAKPFDSCEHVCETIGEAWLVCV